ncbi:MAG: hypothetical protein J7513_04085 [Solirubrobacteraceae bacterium]|nr:hypothetical protein [Solirubrobacteraceae bacterium]
MRVLPHTRALLLAAVAAGTIGGSLLSGGAVAETTPAPTTATSPAPTTPAPTTPPGPVLALPFGPGSDVSYRRLAQMRGLDFPVTTSEPATIRVELVIPRSIARVLKVKVGKRQVRAVLARTTVTADRAGEVMVKPRFGKKIAERLAAKKRHFKLTVRAISGKTVVSAVVTIKTRD